MTIHAEVRQDRRDGCNTGWGISLGTVGVAVSRLKPHLSNFGSLLKLQRLIFPESLGMIK